MDVSIEDGINGGLRISQVEERIIARTVLRGVPSENQVSREQAASWAPYRDRATARRRYGPTSNEENEELQAMLVNAESRMRQ